VPLPPPPSAFAATELRLLRAAVGTFYDLLALAARMAEQFGDGGSSNGGGGGSSYGATSGGGAPQLDSAAGSDGGAGAEETVVVAQLR
jgi:hypothetical protein